MSATIIPRLAAGNARTGPGLLDRIARMIILSRLRRIDQGALEIEEQGRTHRFGVRQEGAAIAARIRVSDPSFWRDLALGGSVGAGRSYMQGAWHCDDLTSLVRLMVRNRAALTTLEGGPARLGAIADRVLHLLRRNTRAGSRWNIAAHYDLGNPFYELFLDRGMNYSCAFFEDETMDLEAAAEAKLDRICRKLDLRPHHHILEIGTGWGGFAIHAAARHGCRVTTTTISREQYEHARRRVREEGLDDRVTVICSDYRDLTGSYDRIVSIEMVEAVGHRYLREYFRRCAALLKPGGIFVLQAIVIAESLHAQALRSVDFIQRYIFPGCSLPSVASLAAAAGGAGDFRLLHLEDIGPHYALTLRRWRDRFRARIAEVRRMGFPESFIRMWDFYLSYCEGGFAERSTGDVQVVLCKPLS